MAKVAARRSGQRAKKRGVGRAPGATVMERAVRTGQDRFETIMNAAERSGLLSEKSSRIAGRVSPALVENAKKRTGIKADTDLIEFALANVALEDNFADTFKAARGKVDVKLKLGF
jgi:hypothetical protein